MTLTKTQKAAAIKHILENVFEQEEDSPLHLAFKQNFIMSPYDIIILSDLDMEGMMYKERDSDASNLLPRGTSVC